MVIFERLLLGATEKYCYSRLFGTYCVGTCKMEERDLITPELISLISSIEDLGEISSPSIGEVQDAPEAARELGPFSPITPEAPLSPQQDDSSFLDLPSSSSRSNAPPSPLDVLPGPSPNMLDPATFSIQVGGAIWITIGYLYGLGHIGANSSDCKKMASLVPHIREKKSDCCDTGHHTGFGLCSSGKGNF